MFKSFRSRVEGFILRVEALYARLTAPVFASPEEDEYFSAADQRLDELAATRYISEPKSDPVLDDVRRRQLAAYAAMTREDPVSLLRDFLDNYEFGDAVDARIRAALDASPADGAGVEPRSGVLGAFGHALRDANAAAIPDTPEWQARMREQAQRIIEALPRYWLDLSIRHPADCGVWYATRRCTCGLAASPADGGKR